MKLFNIFALSLIGLSTLLNAVNAIPCPQCDYELASIYGIPTDIDIYIYFKKIYYIIDNLAKAQISSNIQGPPDFSKVEKGLFELGKTIDQSTEILKIYKGTLNDFNVEKIDYYLKLSSKDVLQITKLIQFGKQFSDKQGYSGVLVNILIGITSQISILFQELELHMPPASFASSGYSISIFVCATAETIDFLQPNAYTIPGMEFCNSLPGLSQSQVDAKQSTSVVTIPQSFTSCGNSATAMYQYGYSTGCISNSTTASTNSPWCDTSGNSSNSSSFAASGDDYTIPSSSDDYTTPTSPNYTSPTSSIDNDDEDDYTPPTQTNSDYTSSSSGSPSSKDNSITSSSATSNNTTNGETIVNIGSTGPGSVVSVAGSGGSSSVNAKTGKGGNSSSKSSSSNKVSNKNAKKVKKPKKKSKKPKKTTTYKSLSNKKSSKTKKLICFTYTPPSNQWVCKSKKGN